MEFSARDVLSQDVGDDGRIAALQESAGADATFRSLGHTAFLHLYESTREQKKLFGLFTSRKTTVWVTDGRGSVKLQVPGGQASAVSGNEAMKSLESLISRHTTYGDAGAQVPAVQVVAGRRVIDLSALQSADQMLAMARPDLGPLGGDENVYFVVKPV